MVRKVAFEHPQLVPDRSLRELSRGRHLFLQLLMCSSKFNCGSRVQPRRTGNGFFLIGLPLMFRVVVMERSCFCFENIEYSDLLGLIVSFREDSALEMVFSEVWSKAVDVEMKFEVCQMAKSSAYRL